MSKETKSMSVIPSDEQRTINEMQAFGWELGSSQEIATKDSHLERKGNTLYSVTESENYVKLIFFRETSIPYYNELNDLYKQYLEYPDIACPHSVINKLLAVILFFFVFPVGMIYIIWGLVKNALNKKEYTDYIVNREEKIEYLLEQAKKYH